MNARPHFPDPVPLDPVPLDPAPLDPVPVEGHDPRPILVVLHQETSTPGRVGRILTARGHRLDIRRPPLGHDLPTDLGGHRGLVVFGGPMSANDPDPYIAAEMALMERALRADLPTLGICLGAQLLVRALGGTVAARADGAVEVGWYPLRATGAGRALLPDWPAMAYQWHSEGFDLPGGATLLATADSYPNQAFSIGSALAVQFHAELTLAMMCRWTVKGAHRFGLPGAQARPAHMAGRLAHDAPLLAWLEDVLMLKFGWGVRPPTAGIRPSAALPAGVGRVVRAGCVRRGW